MARIFFANRSIANSYFRTLKEKSKLSWKLLAIKLGISDRQLRDWKANKYSLPESVTKFAKNQYGLKTPLEVSVRVNNWHVIDAARKGAQRRFEMYGELSTPEGRRRGGLNSLKTHKSKNTGFLLAKKIKRPRFCSKLAEIIGILMGDGGMTNMQIRISLNSITDNPYASYLSTLFRETFGISASTVNRNNELSTDLVLSSKRLVNFLNRKGLPIGNKIRHGLDIPRWINNRKSWQKACLRGLFDTDGCTYIDYHKVNGKNYANLGLSFATHSTNLLENYARVLRHLSFSPTLTTRKRVVLRREREVVRFFEEIKPKNIRHWNIYKKFLEEYRSGYNGTASKAVVSH